VTLSRRSSVHSFASASYKNICQNILWEEKAIRNHNEAVSPPLHMQVVKYLKVIETIRKGQRKKVQDKYFKGYLVYRA
jgi:hypothetical protein